MLKLLIFLLLMGDIAYLTLPDDVFAVALLFLVLVESIVLWRWLAK